MTKMYNKYSAIYERSSRVIPHSKSHSSFNANMIECDSQHSS